MTIENVIRLLFDSILALFPNQKLKTKQQKKDSKELET